MDYTKTIEDFTNGLFASLGLPAELLQPNPEDCTYSSSRAALDTFNKSIGYEPSEVGGSSLDEAMSP